jgi:ABC-2 type transport system ATP-binding protein
MGESQHIVSAEGLCKSYGELRAVVEATFSIAHQETFGLLGPNGAGKTTTIHMLVGALQPDCGRIEIDGAGDPSCAKARRTLGVAPQSLALYLDLSGAENVTFYGRLYGLRGARLRERVEWALDFCGLAERRKDLARNYSGGMKRRLNLACAIVHQPRLLLLDEPTVGVDPQSRNRIFENIEELKREGCAILYTTHYMEEAQRLCDRVAIMDRGKIIAIDTVEGLLNAHGGLSVVDAILEKPPADPSKLPGTLEGDRLRIETESPWQVVTELSALGVAVRTLTVEQTDLEAVFLQLTGRRLRD